MNCTTTPPAANTVAPASSVSLQAEFELSHAITQLRQKLECSAGEQEDEILASLFDLYRDRAKLIGGSA